MFAACRSHGLKASARHFATFHPCGSEQRGHLAKVLFAMDTNGLSPQQQQHTLWDSVCPFLDECSKCGDIESGRTLHATAVIHGLHSINVLADHLIRLFTTCESLLEVNLVFCQVTNPSLYTWQAILSAHTMLGEIEITLELYHKMQLDGVTPGKVTFLCILKACAEMEASEQGRLVHDQVILYGLEKDLLVGSTLINMYAKCGVFGEARKVLGTLPNRNVVSWNALITCHVLYEHSFAAFDLFRSMQLEGIEPNEVTYSSILKLCGEIGVISEGKLIHAQVIEQGLYNHTVVGSSLVDLYMKTGNFEEAWRVLDMIKTHNLVIWNMFLSGFVQYEQGHCALALFEKMLYEGMKPDNFTLSSVLKACGIAGDLIQGNKIHEEIVRRGFDQDLVLGNGIVDMYAKCGSLDEALKVFNKLRSRDEVSWGTMLAGCIYHGSVGLDLLNNTEQGSFTPSNLLYLLVLKDCGGNLALRQAKLTHAQIMRSGLENDILVGSALIDVYVKCGTLEDALTVFKQLPTKDTVSWNTMIAGFVQNENFYSALELYVNMQLDEWKPNENTCSAMLKACGSINTIEQGKLIHDTIIRNGIVCDTILGNTLVYMYAKCGALDEARVVLNWLPMQDVGTWGALIGGCTDHGRFSLAKDCFEEMQLRGIQPDEKSYTSILATCSRKGDVGEGYCHLASMKMKHGITPSVEHFNCMVDLLASRGYLKEALNLLERMPIQQNPSGWMSLLVACRRYGDIACGKQCFDQVFQLDSSIAASYVLLTNIYADANMWDGVQKIGQLMTSSGVSRKPGLAWIESNNKLTEFIVKEKTDLEVDATFDKIKRVGLHMREEGLMPRLDLVFDFALQDEV